MMAAGCNVGITSRLYEQAGGFPRTRIEQLHEDRALVNAVRRLTRELTAPIRCGGVCLQPPGAGLGLANTLLWYKDHAYCPPEVDIRDPALAQRPARTSIALAARHERRLLLAAHPLAFPFIDAIGGPVRRVPGLGVVVKDADLMRAVLMDSYSFGKSGPGSPGDLWTPVLGPRVLMNMDGADHLELRRKLAPLFSPGSVARPGRRFAGAGHQRLSERLQRGEEVDLVSPCPCTRRVP
jgi:hypothetical protein